MKGKLILFNITGILCLLAAAMPGAYGASFDCSRASTPVEKMICADDRLSDLDEVLVKFYRKVLSDAANPESAKAVQRGWTRDTRNKCRDAHCLTRVYEERIQGLTNDISVSGESVRPPGGKKPAKVSQYACADGTRLQVSWSDDFGSMTLTYKNVVHFLVSLTSASGARYGDGKMIFWEKGGQAFVEINGEIVHQECVVRK